MAILLNIVVIIITIQKAKLPGRSSGTKNKGLIL